jgi:acetyl-CoA synthetase
MVRRVGRIMDPFQCDFQSVGKPVNSRDKDVWVPSLYALTDSNLANLIRSSDLQDYDAFLEKSVADPAWYWSQTLRHMDIVFDPTPAAFVDKSKGNPWARFFPDAGFNFAAACLAPPPGENGAAQPAIIAEDEEGRHDVLTYGDLASRTKALAGGLVDAGVKPGDRVALLFHSSAEAVISFLATCYLGAIAVPLYSGYGADAVIRRLQDGGAGYLMTADRFRRRGKDVALGSIASSVSQALPGLKIIIAYEDSATRPAFEHQRWQDLAGLSRHVPPPARTLATTPFMIIYTSGTSGKPKGVTHVHAGFPLRVAQDTAFLFDFKKGDRFFWPSDMGWMVGPYSICASLLLKGALVLYSGSPDRPDIGRLRKVVAACGVTHFGTTPTAVRNMAADEDKVLATPAPSMRVLMTGGEVIDADAHRWLFQKFGNGELPIINYSGGTECSGAMLTNVCLRPIIPCHFNTTAPGVDVRIVDGAGVEQVDAVGELSVFQPFNGMTSGFWQDDQRYLDTYWSRFPDSWVHGDLVIKDAAGQCLMLGRSDDVMKISGRRVGPSEIEGSVIDGEIIADVLAFGVPDRTLGEAMVLFVVPGADGRERHTSAIEEHVNATLRKKMGPSFRANAVVVMPELLKTRNGKLVRRLAREAWLNRKPGDLNAVENPAVFDATLALCAAFRARRSSSD